MSLWRKGFDTYLICLAWQVRRFVACRTLLFFACVKSIAIVIPFDLLLA